MYVPIVQDITTELSGVVATLDSNEEVESKDAWGEYLTRSINVL